VVLQFVSLRLRYTENTSLKALAKFLNINGVIQLFCQIYDESTIVHHMYIMISNSKG